MGFSPLRSLDKTTAKLRSEVAGVLGLVCDMCLVLEGETGWGGPIFGGSCFKRFIRSKLFRLGVRVGSYQWVRWSNYIGSSTVFLEIV